MPGDGWAATDHGPPVSSRSMSATTTIVHDARRQRALKSMSVLPDATANEVPWPQAAHANLPKAIVDAESATATKP
jgi:hypothetical protein